MSEDTGAVDGVMFRDAEGNIFAVPAEVIASHRVADDDKAGYEALDAATEVEGFESTAFRFTYGYTPIVQYRWDPATGKLVPASR